MDLNNKTFLQYAMHSYQNPSCNTLEEFQEDLNHFRYIKRLLNVYRRSSVLKERLLINHFMLLFNVFENHAAVRMIFFKIGSQFHAELKTILLFLDKLPKQIESVNGKMIAMDNILIDFQMLKQLDRLLEE